MDTAIQIVVSFHTRAWATVDDYQVRLLAEPGRGLTVIMFKISNTLWGSLQTFHHVSRWRKCSPYKQPRADSIFDDDVDHRIGPMHGCVNNTVERGQQARQRTG